MALTEKFEFLEQTKSFAKLIKIEISQNYWDCFTNIVNLHILQKIETTGFN